MSLRPRRTCRLFWCYECQRSVRVISSPSFAVSFCPAATAHFLHELELPLPPSLCPRRPSPPPAHRAGAGPPGLRWPGPTRATTTPGGPAGADRGAHADDRPGPPPAPASAIEALARAVGCPGTPAGRVAVPGLQGGVRGRGGGEGDAVQARVPFRLHPALAEDAQLLPCL
ncbi:uncharacterized protein A4U43_C06F17660 [Asparagus officinalis]|uniref:Uncharacterized protein n=1 Tax=Asparagus officinalis TaxID=4686 RepID=A0A5P1EMI6_ASPOF|nr:uncharacterized protein A4U43_C06F17660 [Asparagus officinalis]